MHRGSLPPQTMAPTRYTTTRITRPHWMTYGLGWFQQDYRGQALDFHTGSIDGMVAIHGLSATWASACARQPRSRRASPRPDATWLIDRYAGGTLRMERRVSSRSMTGSGGKPRRNAPRRTASARPRHVAIAAAGEIRRGISGSASRRCGFAPDGGGLRIGDGMAFVGPLEHWHHNTFRANWSAAWREP